MNGGKDLTQIVKEIQYFAGLFGGNRPASGSGSVTAEFYQSKYCGYYKETQVIFLICFFISVSFDTCWY